MACADPSFSSIRYLPTTEAYDRWAAVYDTDGNFLQAMDTHEMKTLLPRFVASITAPKPWRIVDLGCGTGRNTALLLGQADTEIVALDASAGMLEVAKSRLQRGAEAPAAKLSFGMFDLLGPTNPQSLQANGIVSTLVVEHVPLRDFFRQVAGILRPGGVLLLTNMHEDMGRISQAGFVDVASGEKIRPKSYAHTVEEVVEEARRWGLHVEGEAGVEERAVEEGMVERLGSRSQKWVGVVCWFGGLFRKTGSGDASM